MELFFLLVFCLFVQKISVARIVQTRIVGVEGKGTTRILSKNPKRLISRSFSCWSYDTSKDFFEPGGAHSTMDSIRALHPAAPGFHSWCSQMFFWILEAAEVNQWRCCLEQWTAEAWQCCSNPSSTLASGKLVLQKNKSPFSISNWLISNK